MMPRLPVPSLRPLTFLQWLLPLLAMLDWWLLRSTSVQHPAGVLAALALASVAVWVVGLVQHAYDVARQRKTPAAAFGPCLVLAGLSLGVGAGLVNWAWSLQGYVVLRETEALPLHHGTHLRAIEEGPLADLDQLQMTLQLVELELRAGHDGVIYPESRIRIQNAAGKVEERVVTPWQNAAVGSLRFFQGAYGFAPRIVLLHQGTTLYDDTVPFTTETLGATGGVHYARRIEVEEQALTIDGAVDTSSLDEAMRGHAALGLEVRRGGVLLGAGRLLPGSFAELAEGYRVGFAGMEQWSEIDFSRRNYRRASLIGFALALAGILWTVGYRLSRRVKRRTE